ncbi:MAG: molybdenum ABC transporter ATP-binding protein [Bosea sp.]|nr:molybdenum ABC transporter ATP-binding protein [Bosea sp. (in: a-proteobacteria)]
MSLVVDVGKRLGSFDLAVRFEQRGRVTALYGPSGSGKTTIVNCVAGLVRPDRGRIAFGETVLFDADAGIDLPPHRRRIGYVFQDARLFPHLSVRANLSYGGWFRRGAPVADFAGIVDLLGIGSLLDRRPRDLSGGEKQRVAIGRALLAHPRLLLMDEPLAALDRGRRAEILPYLERLADDMTLPILYVSHAIEEVARLADQAVIIEAGRIVADGPIDRVFAGEGRDHAIGGILSAKVIEADGDGVTALAHAGGRLHVPRLSKPAGSEVRVVIRARDIALALGEPGIISIRNRLAALVASVAEDGDEIAVTLDVAGTPLVARVTRAAARELGLAPGVAVTALIKAVALEDR